MPTTTLPPEAPFSKTIFQLIRPHIPREHWPLDSVRANFVPGADGLWLYAEFDGFPKAYAGLAARLVADGRVDLVLKSPAALPAMAVVRTKRWRDACLFAFLPLMFAIPIMAILNENIMRVALLLFSVDVVLLSGLQLLLVRCRARMAAARFIAQIPAPGLKIKLRPQSADKDRPEMPEV